MNTHKQTWSRAVIVMALAGMLHSPLASRAQDTQGPAIAEDSNAPDPPGRIARVSFMDGSVSFQSGGENDWVGAVPNRPLVSGDNLWSDANSRAEVHIGSTALHLGPQTGITLLEVSDHAAQIRLAQGSLIVKVRHVDDDDSYEIDTPNVAFVVMQPGDYRFDVAADGSRTNVTVWRGRGQATGGGSSYALVAGQHAAFTGNDPINNGQINFDLGQVPAGDGFDNWASQRDRDEDQSDSANYVSRDMSGYEDLDAYGNWTFIPGYGAVWQPTVVVAGWAPYRFGRWAWVGPWGWTWVADEPWGFAPFHYGRWANGANGWMWVPGPKAVRPVYAPALVAWLGGGPKSNFSFSFGAGVGWLPLAPGEVFIPGYRVSRNYVNRVNTTNTAVNVTRINEVYNTVVVNRGSANNLTYANRGVSGSVTVVSRDTFVNSRAVASNAVSVPEKELASAPVSHTVAAEPVRGGVIGAGKTIATKPPAAVTSRQVVALRTPAPTPQAFGQPQAQVGSQANQAALVRQQAPGHPVPVQPSVPASAHTSRSLDSVHSIEESSPGVAPKPAARVWEAQGTPEPVQTQPATFKPETIPSSQPAKGSRPVARPVAPTVHPVNQVREPEPKPSSWQSKPATTTSTQHTQSHTSTIAPRVESVPRK